MRNIFGRVLSRVVRLGLTAAAGALLVVGFLAVAPVEFASADQSPVSTPTPPAAAAAPLAMGTYSSTSYAAQAAKLPPTLATALKRDVGLTPTQYLADSAAAARAVKVVASLESAGVDVLGSHIVGTQLTVNVASPSDAPIVAAAGASAVVGPPAARDYSHVSFQKVTTTNTYGGEAYFYQEAGQTGGAGYRCSIGFNGYAVSTGAAQFATAGHCETTIGGSAYFLPQSAPTPPDANVGNLGAALGSGVSGQYGSGSDYGIVSTDSTNFTQQPGLATWGYGSTSAPLASAALPITGQTAGIVGANLCKSGSTTGWTCGTISAVDQAVSVSGQTVNAIVASTCLLPRDSGGGAVIGTNAVGIDSGGTFGTSCNTPGGESVFFPLVSATSSNSLTGQDADWRLLAAPLVTSPAAGGTVSASASMTGTLFNPLSSSTVALYLDGSSTAFATVSASSGAWTIPLSGLAQGLHTYSLSVSGNGWTSNGLVTGSFIEAVTSMATVTSPTSGQPAYPSTVMTGTISSPTSASTALLFLNGSSTAFANVDASSGSWSIPLAGLALGTYNYSIAAGIGSIPGVPVSGSFIETAIPPTQSHVDSITGGVGTIGVAGWAVWPDRLSTAVNVAVNVGSSWTGLTANQATSDSGLPSGAGTMHGFSGSLSEAPGTYSVCIWAGGSGGGATNIGCQTVTVLAAPPTQSHVDSITGGVGTIGVAGWAVWPDRLSTAVNVAVNVGSSWTGLTANQATSDSGLPSGAGTMHGFSGSLSEAPGTYSVCIWAGGSGGGATNIGCQTVTVLAAPPTQSHVDSITGGVGTIGVAGWAVWPDRLSTAVNVAVNVGSSWTGLTANQATSDSGLPSGAGTMHGFSGSLSEAPGTYSVCIWAGGSGGGATNIGCQTVTVLAAPPTQSHVDSITGGVGTIGVAGWAVWPDRLSTAVNVAVNVGSSWTGLTANQATSDSGLPSGAGTMHGFSGSLSEAPGTYSVCIWAGGSGGGATNIGCQTVTVLAAPPTQSHVDSITGGVGTIGVAGWAVWPDRLSTAVNVAVNVGSSWTGLTANQATSDSGLPSGAGTMHGFSGSLSEAPGTYSVCIWAGGSGGGATNIGCQTVTVLAAPPTQSHVDSITGGVGTIGVAGWAVWPDRLSTAVNVAVNVGSSWTGLTANQATSDSGLPSGAGTMHGFSGSLSEAPGTYSVCIWAGGSGGGATNIGCQTVTVLAAPR